MTITTEEIDIKINGHIRIAKKLLLSEKAYFASGNLKTSENMRRKKRTIYRKLNRICPHDKGYTEPTYWNDGVSKCQRCGNSRDCLTNGFVDGWTWN